MAQTSDRLLKSLTQDDPYALPFLRRREIPEGSDIRPMVQELPLTLPVTDSWSIVTPPGGASWGDIYEF